MKNTIQRVLVMSIVLGVWSTKSFAESISVEVRSYKGYLNPHQAVMSVMGFMFGNVKYDTYYFDDLQMETILGSYSRSECNGTAKLVTDGRSIAVDTYTVTVSCERLNLPPAPHR